MKSRFESSAEYQFAEKVLRDWDANPDPALADVKLVLARAYMAMVEDFIPQEPTEEMIAAGATLEGQRVYGDSEVRNIYREMVAAAKGST